MCNNGDVQLVGESDKYEGRVRFALAMSGEPCVMTSGGTLTLVLFAFSLDTPEVVGTWNIFNI